jgi:hypothetical protein
MRKKFAVAVCIGAVTALTASPAFAGEVKGPPGGGGGDTAGPLNSASLCAFSGLNDFNQGQTETITQNWGQDVRLGIAGQEGPIPGIGCNPTAG